MFQEILAKFNPATKVPYKTLAQLKAKLVLLMETSKKTDTSDRKVDINPEMVEFGIKLQTRVEESKSEAQMTLISLFFSTDQSQIETLDFEEVEQLWSKIEEARPTLVDRLKLNSKTDTEQNI